MAIKELSRELLKRYELAVDLTKEDSPVLPDDDAHASLVN